MCQILFTSPTRIDVDTYRGAGHTAGGPHGPRTPQEINFKKWDLELQLIISLPDLGTREYYSWQFVQRLASSSAHPLLRGICRCTQFGRDCFLLSCTCSACKFCSSCVFLHHSCGYTRSFNNISFIFYVCTLYYHCPHLDHCARRFLAQQYLTFTSS